jgi:hypothetical protein
MPNELTWRQAIDAVLGSSSVPLHYNEIAEKIVQQGLRQSLGATPASTVNANITNSIKHEGDSSPYIRVSKGVFAMRNDADVRKAVSPRLAPNVSETTEEEEQYEIITSFGMYWQRDAVQWISTPRILGMQQIGATPVDVCNQLGIYLLYDGREVIYVGRSTERPLGRRLYEHTVDRLSTRWNRFSWFGLLPVGEDGTLGTLPDSYDAPKLMPALEAILIEALEPRQNRKRGDDLSAVEYFQKVDPAVEIAKLKSAFDAAIGKT